ncbi:MAG: lipoyl(octanoyl) transferase LipB [Saprospiraceae bacterium]|nr:lipoyl(octanoyl) transferase LipB [Saprospiraceae bacterium]
MTMQQHRPRVDVLDWGVRDYKFAWDEQTNWHKRLIEQKRSGVENEVNNKLILCEHPPVYTLGKSGSIDNLVWNDDERKIRGVEYYKINRGGDVTYHGPGQLVVYPIFDMDQFFRDVHLYVRNLEEVIIRLLDTFGIAARRIDEYTGVWLEGQPNRKICAIGVHMSRWVSMHGLALNVNTNLEHFQGIVPCGINDEDKIVTSMERETGSTVDMLAVKQEAIKQFQEIFEFEIEQVYDTKSQTSQ